jgi:hypothetical protein
MKGFLFIEIQQKLYFFKKKNFVLSKTICYRQKNFFFTKQKKS